MLGSYASGHSLHVRVTQTLRLINKIHQTPLLKSGAKVHKKNGAANYCDFFATIATTLLL